MPLYMDRHELKGATAEEIAAAHIQDLALQERHGVDYVSYWFDYARQNAFCLARGPSREAVETVHRESHGLTALEIIEVDESQVGRFMGGIPSHPVGEAYEDSAFRAILFTDLVGSTDLTQRLGDAAAMDILRRHDTVVRQHISAASGSEVKHTGDGIMASFRTVSGAIECAIGVQRWFAAATAKGEMPVHVRIGIAAGEPVAQNGDLFGSAVQLAARVTARAAPGSILVSSAVRDLAQGKGFQFGRRSRAKLKGFSAPVQLDEVVWHTTD
ncbi:MAG TPA: nickel-binding protein [Candidatus Limnocylindrales bacterium]